MGPRMARLPRLDLPGIVQHIIQHNVGWVGFINPASRDLRAKALGWWSQPSLRPLLRHQARWPSNPMRRNHISTGTVTSGGTAASNATSVAHHGQRKRNAVSTVAMT